MAIRDKRRQAEHSRNHYLLNRAQMIAKAKENNVAARARNKEFLLNYLSKHPCVDCGESDPIVLEFDHIDRSRKTSNIAALVGNSFSIARISHEIAKCDVRCANCHRRKTYKDRDWEPV